jgi:ASC-1-like (ASCH) protein
MNKPTHDMQLNAEPFLQIMRGDKVVEFRLYDEKRRKFNAGDYIIFTNKQTCEKLFTQIVELYRGETFEKLHDTICEKGLPSGAEDKNDFINIMREYYSADNEKQFGVIGIHIKKVMGAHGF